MTTDATVPPDPAAMSKVHRVGLIISNTPELQTPALRYLILHLNCLQKLFEYEILPNELEDSPLEVLNSRSEVEDRINLRDAAIPKFLVLYEKFLRHESETYHLKEEPPTNFVFISLATFKDGYYSTRPNLDLIKPNRMSILALGNWEKEMAPPSILEFILTLVLRESVAFVAPSLRTSIHLGTKGCICDFTNSLEEAKFKALQGFVCEYCRSALARDGVPELADWITRILRKEWLGERSNSASVAGILANLHYDLFVTKGFTPTFWERSMKVLQEEGTKQALDILGKIIVAVVLFYLSVHGIRVRQ
jgi:hypothetical protein